MKYLHTMVRVGNLDKALEFYCDKLGLENLGRYDNEGGRFSLVFLAAPGQKEAQVELTWNWDEEELGEAAISAIWPMRSRTSTRSATG